jgi:cysteine desulfurase family protein (TIGR01976 family)
MPLDVAYVRRQFPAFDNPETARWAFLENAGGSYVCAPVVDRLHHFMTAHKVQPYGPFALAERAGEAMDQGYRTVAALLATDEEQVTLGPSTSANTYTLARALRPGWQPGDEIVVTNQDHEANIGAWRRLAQDGIVVREWRVDADGELDPEGLEGLLGPRTRLVAFSLCSNLVGTLAPLAEITAIARRHGAMTVGDGVSFAPHRPLAVEASGLDFYLFSTYKTFGTHLGVLWGRREALARTTNQSHWFNHDKPRARLNPAGPQHAEIAALGGLEDYFADLHRHHFGEGGGSLFSRAEAVWGLVREHETRLTRRLLEGVASIGGFRPLGRADRAVEERVSVVSLRSERLAPSLVARGLGERAVAVRHGDFYARRLVESLGLDPEEGVLRISMVHYNDEADVDRCLAALEEVVTSG